MFETVTTEELKAMETLARRVRNELAAAGLPVLAPDLDSSFSGGAEVDIDDGADSAGGVFVSWAAAPSLRASTSRTFRAWQRSDPQLQQPDEPVLRRMRHSSEIDAAMMGAMAAILASAGYTTQDAQDSYRPHHLRVTAGPASGSTPLWAPHDEEASSD
ncbi:hypothetical protein ACWGDE_16250 [Streptomyces sp. NPDC054956]